MSFFYFRGNKIVVPIIIIKITTKGKTVKLKDPVYDEDERPVVVC
jgi:hypothetical protein